MRDTAQAVFEIDDYVKFVEIQAEAAIRHLATMYAYDTGDDLHADETTLRAGLEVVANALKAELNQRFARAGVEVLDAKLTHLAYAAEIAQVMLRRQQAVAIVSARHQIVAGAVGMVEAALKGLSERNLVHLDDERKAAMVSNLLVVLCSDKDGPAHRQHRHAVLLSDGQPGKEGLSAARGPGAVGRDRTAGGAGAAQRQRAGGIPAARGAGAARPAAEEGRRRRGRATAGPGGGAGRLIRVCTGALFVIQR